MKVTIKQSEPVLVFSAPINESTLKWGVYALPRMWRSLDGNLIIRFNGDQDCVCTENMHQAPNLFFRSKDNGETWEKIEDVASIDDRKLWIGIAYPYLKKKDGKILAFDFKGEFFEPIGEEIPYIKEVLWANKDVVSKIYRYGDIPDECKAIKLITIDFENGTNNEDDITILFDDLEIYAVSKSLYDDEWVDEKKPYVRCWFHTMYFTAMTELNDGTLAAIAFGQEPCAYERYYGKAYLMVSADDGRTWKKRSEITKYDKENFPYGYFFEASINADSDDGILRCLIRTEVCIDPAVEYPICDTIYFESSDNGYTWTEPKSISDGSVTPHIVTLKDGILLEIYGRPGVHFKYSCDGGKNWSESHSIIGLTLEEERANGVSDRDSKYFDTSSYSNNFIDKISDDTVLVCYNDMRYDEGDGKKHKAGFVRKITIKYEE